MRPVNNKTTWAKTLLKRLGVPESHGAVKALVGWANAEGGHWSNSARYNPLNTTLRMHGSTVMGGGNTAGVQSYQSWHQGLKATAKTLSNYPGVLQALRSGNSQAVAHAVGSSPWGTPSGLLSSAIASAKVGHGYVAGGGGGGGHSPSRGNYSGGGGGGGLMQQPAPDFTGMRQSLLLNYVDQQNNPDALLNLALGMRSIVDQQQQQPARGFTGGGRSRGGGGGGGGQGASGPVLGRAKPGRPDLATSVGGLHPTMGLPGYPAHDYFAPAHSPVVAPVSGKVIRLSGHPPSAGPVEGPHGPLGWSVYIQGNDGRTYYLTHMGTRTVRAGQRVRQGQKIGTVANYAKYGTPNHIHMGVHG